MYTLPPLAGRGNMGGAPSFSLHQRHTEGVEMTSVPRAMTSYCKVTDILYERFHSLLGERHSRAKPDEQSHQKWRVTSLPKGASESCAILKCCRAKGIPIIVTNSSMPKNTCVSHAHKPPKTIHMILSGIVIHPDDDAVSLTSAPKGQRHSSPILNVCRAKGMPMMVRATARLPVK